MDGTESLKLNVRTRNGSKTEQLIIPFYALGLTKGFNSFADAMLTFSGTETAELDVVDTNGNSWTLNLVFPPQIISVVSEDPIDINNYLDEVGKYLDSILEKAESDAGFEAGKRLFEKVKVRRVTQDDLIFGTLEINFSFKSVGPEKGSVNITNQNKLEIIGFDVASKPSYGKLTLPTDNDALREYITRSLREGQEDSKFIQGNRILSDKVGVDFNVGKLEILISLSDEDGGEGAFISVANESGLEILGFDNTKSITGVSNVVDGRAITKENRQKIINDVFTGALIRLGAIYTSSDNKQGWSDYKAKTFDRYDAILIAIVGKPPSNEWNAEDPEGIRNAATGDDNWRMFTTHLSAVYLGLLPVVGMIRPQTHVPLTSAIIDKNIFGPSDDRSITACHELGHAIGFSDMYPGGEFRDDLLYLGAWDIMGWSSGDSHFCGYHKWAADWISDTEVVRVGLPDSSNSIDIEVLLVPIEYWDSDLTNAVKSVYSDLDLNKVKVAQLVLIELGGDGVQFDLIEARQQGKNFSNHLPAQPALLVTNNIIRKDDTRYAVIYDKFNPKEKLDPDKVDLDKQTTDYILRYRRRIHVLNKDNALTKKNDTFDLGEAAELAAKGVSIKINDIRKVPRTYGDVEVFHVKIHREPADFVDLYLTKGDPTWASPDIWIDWTGDNNDPKDNKENMYIYPVGTPIDQGEPVRYPPSNSNDNELHWIGGRVWNGGSVEVRNVKVNVFMSIPPGSGDQNLNKNKYDDTIIERIPAHDWHSFSIPWEVKPDTTAHMCIRADITDWDLPQAFPNATELGGDDLKMSNNWAQKNVIEFIPTPASPYEEISFIYSVKNGGLKHETAIVEPEGLPYGITLTVTPHRRTIGPRETGLFHCKLKLDDKIIDTGCRNDKSFMLVAWRETDHTEERWGGCKYEIKPRKRTATQIGGSWIENFLLIYGSVTPTPYIGQVQIRLAIENEKSFWVNVHIEEGGVFKLKMSPEKGTKLNSIAYYEGSTEYGPSTSNIIHLEKSIIT